MRLRLWLICLSGSWGLLWGDNTILNISSSGVKKMSIAIGSFVLDKENSLEESKNLEVRTIVQNDLFLSDFFEIKSVDVGDSLAMKKALVQAYLQASYYVRLPYFYFFGNLFDAVSRNIIFSKEYKVKHEFYRNAVHTFSDDIVHFLFGERGVARTKIIFSSQRSRNKEIYIMDYDGESLKQVTSNGSINLTPCFSHQNDELLYTSYLNKRPLIYLTSLYSDRTQVFIKTYNLNMTPSWSPNGDEVVFSGSVNGNLDIYVIKVNGHDVRRLTFDKAVDSSPSWSPNGEEIVFMSMRTGSAQIFVMDRYGANVRRVTYVRNQNEAPAWSPRGNRIAYHTFENGQYEICMIDLDGGNFRQLTRDSGNNEDPNWSPNGKLICFTSTRAGFSQIFIMNTDGSRQIPVTTGSNDYSPSWSYFKEGG